MDSNPSDPLEGFRARTVRVGSLTLLLGSAVFLIASTVLGDASLSSTGLALVDAREGRIDLLFTDIVLPGRSGVELARALEPRLGMPVLYVSGFTEGGVVRRGALDPGVQLLQKPFTGAELLEKVRAALGR